MNHANDPEKRPSRLVSSKIYRRNAVICLTGAMLSGFAANADDIKPAVAIPAVAAAALVNTRNKNFTKLGNNLRLAQSHAQRFADQARLTSAVCTAGISGYLGGESLFRMDNSSSIAVTTSAIALGAISALMTDRSISLFESQAQIMD